MHIVKHSIAAPGTPCEEIFLEVERAALSKRRWRAQAPDGTEFGFDLEHPLQDGSAIWREGSKLYRLRQKPEPVLEIPFGTDTTLAEAAQLGWKIGNLHFPVQVTDRLLRVAEDPAIRQLLAREGTFFNESVSVFYPISCGGHTHAH